MAKTVLLIGTRKGAFVMESDNRKDWQVRGPFCDSWPVYHAVYEPKAGAIYAAAASEWHGAAIFRSTDLGETWTHSSAGIEYDDGRRLSKVSSLAADGDRILVGVEAPGIFESRDRGETWSVKTTLSDQLGYPDWDNPENQPPGHLGISNITLDPSDSSHWWTIVQGHSLFETTDDGKTFAPRNKGLRRDWPAEHEEVGYCVHRVAHSPDPQRKYQQNHVGMHRSDDGGQTWTEITEGLPSDFGFAAAAHPHDRETFYCIPLAPDHGRTMPDGQAAVWRTRDGGSSWQKLTNGLPQEDAYVGVLRSAMTMDTTDDAGLYFGTSTGQVFASHDDGDSWSEIASYLPGISSVEVVTLD